MQRLTKYRIAGSLLFTLTLAGLMTACKEKDVAPADDNEAITTATLQLTNKANAAEVLTATVDNLDKTADFSKATLNLKPNTVYSGKVLLSDKTKTPTLDVSAEILKEVNEHLFIYTPSATTLLTVAITDKDTNPAPGPYPVGLSFDLTTKAAGTGKLNVVLRHQPNAKNGTPTPGTTDLDTTFPVVVK